MAADRIAQFKKMFPASDIPLAEENQCLDPHILYLVRTDYLLDGNRLQLVRLILQAETDRLQPSVRIADREHLNRYVAVVFQPVSSPFFIERLFYYMSNACIWQEGDCDKTVKAIDHDLIPADLQNQYLVNITRADFAALVINLLIVTAGKDIDEIVLAE